jgi:hypothetical protein
MMRFHHGASVPATLITLLVSGPLAIWAADVGVSDKEILVGVDLPFGSFIAVAR